MIMGERSKKKVRLTETNSKLVFEQRSENLKQEWMDFMVNMIKQKSGMHNMSDKDIEGTIRRARPILFVTKEAKIDPDMPDCYYWNELKVAQWIHDIGFPEVKDMFVHNNINGRRLITIDASALNQMGMRDLGRMRQVTANIRQILGTAVPNALRALMRLVPWEIYLKRKIRTGIQTDALTFKVFCQQQGFPYALLRGNKCAYIPCTCPVELKLGCKHHPDPEICESQRGSGSTSSDNSVKYCPSVENVVRKMPLRDKVIQKVLDEMTKTVIDRIAEIEAEKEEAANARALKLKRDRSIEFRVRRIFDEAYAALGIDKSHLSQSRVEFVASVAEELVEDIFRTREILCDIDNFQSYMDYSMDPTTMKNALEIASEFLDEVSAISTMLTLGQLELESLIKDAPYIQSYVNDIIQTAEKKVAQKNNDDGIRSDNPSVKDILSTTRFSLMQHQKKA